MPAVTEVVAKPHFHSSCERGCFAPAGHLDVPWGHPQKGHWIAVREGLVVMIHWLLWNKTFISLLPSQAIEMVQRS